MSDPKRVRYMYLRDPLAGFWPNRSRVIAIRAEKLPPDELIDGATELCKITFAFCSHEDMFCKRIARSLLNQRADFDECTFITKYHASSADTITHFLACEFMYDLKYVGFPHWGNSMLKDLIFNNWW